MYTNTGIPTAVYIIYAYCETSGECVRNIRVNNANYIYIYNSL